jgi:hypothetical protein
MYCRDLSTGLPWQAATSIAVDAPSDHWNDGVHRIWYMSVAGDGLVEAPQTRLVNIDTRKPTPRAPTAAAAVRGRTAALKYKVLDTKPNGGTVAVKIVVKSPSGKVVKTLKPVVKPVDTALTWKFTVPRTWRVGTYKFYVYATDTAGNTQAKVASNKLIVK